MEEIKSKLDKITYFFPLRWRIRRKIVVGDTVGLREFASEQTLCPLKSSHQNAQREYDPPMQGMRV